MTTDHLLLADTVTLHATAYVRNEFAAPGTQLEFLVRDKAEPCTVRELPFYKRAK